MNVLILDTDATGLDLAWRAAEAGHAVRWWIPPTHGVKARHGEGFPRIERVDTWKPHMAWAKNGLVVNLFNDRKLTVELDRWREFGFTIFGPTAASARLEWERGAGMRFMQEHGIEIPKFHTFKTLDECIAFAWKADQPYVFKTAGDLEDKSLSYVASDPADLVAYLEHKKREGLKLKGEMYLQEKIDMIAEVGVSAWVGKQGFLPDKFTVNFEHKKLMAGDFGPSTGEEGTVIKHVKDGAFPEILRTFEDSMVKLGHLGDFDIGCGIDSQGKVWPFEFSNRFGWPSTQIAFACYACDPVEWMYDAATTGRDSLVADDRVAIGVLMTRPPYPTHNGDPSSSVGYRIEGLDEVWEHVSPWGIMISQGPTMKDGKVVKDRIYETADDYVCVVTALGHDVHDVIPQVYATVDRIKFADRQVRNDIGKRLEHELPKLHALGFDELPNW